VWSQRVADATAFPYTTLFRSRRGVRCLGISHWTDRCRAVDCCPRHLDSIQKRTLLSDRRPSFGPTSQDVGGSEGRRGGGSADNVRIATEPSNASASCSERRRPSAFGLRAVAALQITAIHTANGTLIRARVGGRVALDMVKNLIWWRLRKCRRTKP